MEIVLKERGNCYTENVVKRHLNQYNLDIRKTRNARFLDQKVTPDVLCTIADCVVKILEVRGRTFEFTVKDIWDMEYFNQTVKRKFSKPDVKEDAAKNEYDKFIHQPLKMLSYANVLLCQKRNRANHFHVNDFDILKYISLKRVNAHNFITLYLSKVLDDSALLKHFEDFRKDNSKEEFDKLKQIFIEFIIENTAINQKAEASRIFTKVLNPYAAKHRIHGTEKGRFSPHIINYSELMYNRPNQRDTGKDKSIPRSVYRKRNMIKKLYKSFLIVLSG